MEERKKITREDIAVFLDGHNPQERIVDLEYNYQDDFITVWYRNDKDEKCSSTESFYPFVWAKLDACLKMCGGNRMLLQNTLRAHNIWLKKLSTENNNGEVVEEMLNGYQFLFFATQPMSYADFLNFFKSVDCPVYPKNKDNTAKKDERLFLMATPQEQYLISTGKRFFKGYDDYNQLLRMIFDLETEGLDPTKDRIKLNGVRLNRAVTIQGKRYENFERIFRVEGNTKEEKDDSELKVIDTMFRLIYTFRPDIITAHNGENFDWNFIIERCKQLGEPIEEFSKKYFDGKFIYKDKKESILKLGGEMETFHKTIVPHTIITDSLHAVRRAQALDSNMQKADLKYVTEYSGMKKPNRVYVPGHEIDRILIDTEEHYAFNNNNGDWYLIEPTAKEYSFDGNPHRNYVAKFSNVAEGYKRVTGQYIVERYLYDDLYECDVVEHRYNVPNFLICKMLPVPFARCCTMGTAGQWKALMMAWSYENDLAIPAYGENKSFTGGLSRLLSTGYVANVAKFDYNSLYPSIILTWGISDKKDLMGTMLAFLEHVLTQREKYKKLKKVAGKKKGKLKEELANFNGTEEERKKLEQDLWQAQFDESANDKKQLPLKILGNSFFGSFGCPTVFPWASIDCAERTTCTGRQCLRLMIKTFSDLGYKPIVGDSFTGDTPLFIKYDDSGMIDIVPIEELINEKEIKVDALGREYDVSEKPYKVLCRSGWASPYYIYRHKTEKDIFEVSEGEMRIEVTEDHSLFNANKEKIKPSEITHETKLEYYDGAIESDAAPIVLGIEDGVKIAREIAHGKRDRVPIEILNATIESIKAFYKIFIAECDENGQYSKTCLAGLQFLKRRLTNGV